MLLKLLHTDIYKKTYSIFSDTYQEKAVSEIEKEFYGILKELKNSKYGGWHQRNKFLALLGKIDSYNNKVNFNPELDVYLKSLKTLTTSYVNKLSEKLSK